MVTFKDQETTRSDVPGPRSPDIDRNGHPSLTYYNTGCTSLTVLSHRQQRMVPEHGLQQKNKKKMLCTAQCIMLRLYHSD